MKIGYTSAFRRMYYKLQHDQQDRVDQIVRLFMENPFHPSLKNHTLKGAKEGVHSIKAGYDLRILYTEKDGHAIVLMIAVGRHDDVY